MRKNARFPLLLSALLLLLLVAAGCVAPPAGEAAPGPVVQGSTAAPTEPPTEATTEPTTAADDPPITIVDTPLPAETATPAPTETPPPPGPTDTPAPAPSPTPATPSPTGAPTAQPTPAPTKTPYPIGIFVASHRGYAEGAAYFVVGEVLNTAGYPVYGAKVIANFYDSGGKLMGAGQALTSLAMTEPEVANPFKLKVENLASSVSRYELSVTWEDVSLIEFRPLAVLEAEVGQGQVVGQIRNEQESTLTSIVVAVTFYDDSGAVVETADVFLGGQTLAPGGEMPFAIPLRDGNLVYDHFWIEAQGNLNLF